VVKSDRPVVKDYFFLPTGRDVMPKAPKSTPTGNLPSRAVQLLGRKTDAEIARQNKRRSLGIPAVFNRKFSERWTPEVMAKLGKVSDAVLARELGVTQASVSAFRRRRGIPPAELQPPLGRRFRC
jgi:hypothetical protein